MNARIAFTTRISHHITSQSVELERGRAMSNRKKSNKINRKESTNLIYIYLLYMNVWTREAYYIHMTYATHWFHTNDAIHRAYKCDVTAWARRFCRCSYISFTHLPRVWFGHIEFNFVYTIVYIVRQRTVAWWTFSV